MRPMSETIKSALGSLDSVLDFRKFLGAYCLFAAQMEAGDPFLCTGNRLDESLGNLMYL